MSDSGSDFYGGLKWFYDCKKFAVQKIMLLVPPADSLEMRMCHALYLYSLFSIIDMSEMRYGKSLRQDLMNALKTDNSTGENNYWYLRNLRNSCVHEGFDPVKAAIVINGQVCAFSPEMVWGKNKEGPYTPFHPLLRNMFAVCEAAVNSSIWKHVQIELQSKVPKAQYEIRTEIKDFLQKSNFAPVWVKSIFPQILDAMPDEHIKDHNLEMIKGIFQEGPTEGLAISNNK